MHSRGAMIRGYPPIANTAAQQSRVAWDDMNGNLLACQHIAGSAACIPDREVP
jgi:hypothetical protein